MFVRRLVALCSTYRRHFDLLNFGFPFLIIFSNSIITAVFIALRFLLYFFFVLKFFYVFTTHFFTSNLFSVDVRSQHLFYGIVVLTVRALIISYRLTLYVRFDSFWLLYPIYVLVAVVIVGVRKAFLSLYLFMDAMQKLTTGF